MFKDAIPGTPQPRRVTRPMDFIVWFLVLLFVFAVASRGNAHSWFPWSCCSDLDCFEIGEGKSEPNPSVTPQGWQLYDGTVVPFSEARPSPDGKFYVCRKQGKSDGDVIHPQGEKPCLWVPQMGF